MVKTIYYFLILLLLSSCASTKGKVIVSENIADCSGALPLLQSGTSTTAFPGTAGKKNEFKNYMALNNLTVGNAIWYSFVAEYDGRFSLKGETESGDLNLVVFQTDGKNICADIESGKAEIKRMLVRENSPTVWLVDRNIKNGLFTLPLNRGDEIYFVIFTRAKKKATLSLDVSLSPNDVNQIVRASDNKLRRVNIASDEFSPTTTITLRDIETGDPVAAQIELDGNKDIKGVYNASDLIIQPSKNTMIDIRCTVEGYFFVDKTSEVNVNSEDTIVVYLQQLKKGKSMQLEGIQFVPSQSTFLPSAEPILLRLREFMALNADISIEIQGHVYEPNESTNSGQAMSLARAQRVLKYLEDSGINKKRMKATGFGGTKPIFPDAKREVEIQANRRVEIVIL